jgi:hypothetical protein
MDVLSKGKIMAIPILCSLFGFGCQPGVKPDIRSGKNNNDSIARLEFQECALNDIYSGQEYWIKGKTGDKEAGALLAILGSSIVTKGVDLLGEKLKAAGESETRSIEAQKNFRENKKIGCIKFDRGNISFKAEILPAVHILNDQTKVLNRKYVDLRLIEFNYGETIDKQSDGVRGIAFTIEVTHPNSDSIISRSISIGNVEVGANIKFTAEDTPFMTEYFENPFARLPLTDQEKNDNILVLNTPFTLRVRITETRNANELAKFAASVIEDSNDKLTEALIRQWGLKEEDQGETTNSQSAKNPPNIKHIN